MAEFIVRVKRVQISYADITITADDLDDAVADIEKLENVTTEAEADWLGHGPGDWEIHSVELTVEDIEDEDGHSLGDMAAMRHAALELED